MKVKPKFRLGQKVILIKSHYMDGKYDVGYIIGISVKRSYDTCGIFQTGGLNCAENERKGLLKNYMDHVNEATYTVLHQVHTRKDHQCLQQAEHILETEIVPYNKENKEKYPVDEYKSK